MMQFLLTYGWLIGALLAAGCLAGLAAGLFGIGGGVVTVPALYAVFNALNIADGPSLKTSIGTSLAVIIVTSLGSLATHHRAGHVDKHMLIGWAPWIAAGSAMGGVLARWMPPQLLAVIFAAGAAYIGYRRVIGKGSPEKRDAPAIDLHAKRMKIPFGVGAGVFSSLMGLGGGAVGVMVMTMAGRAMHQAIATSAGFGVAVAVPGTLSFIVAGWGIPGVPPGSIGYVNLPAFITLALAAGLMAPIGARLAHQLDGDLLSKIFGVYVSIAAIALIIDIFTG